MYRAEIDCDMRSFTQRTQKKFMKADLLKEHSHQKIKKKKEIIARYHLLMESEKIQSQKTNFQSFAASQRSPKPLK